MKQVLLSGTRAWEGTSITVWAPDQYQVGDTVRWNGFPWRVTAQYGTHFSACLEARKREKPDENPLEAMN